MLIPSIKLTYCCDNNFVYIISLSLPHIVCLYIKLAFVSISLPLWSIVFHLFPQMQFLNGGEKLKTNTMGCCRRSRSFAPPRLHLIHMENVIKCIS